MRYTALYCQPIFETSMKEDYYYSFDDDTPGDIVEALNEDKSIILWDINVDGSGVMIKIDYKGLHIKKVKNGNIIKGIDS